MMEKLVIGRKHRLTVQDCMKVLEGREVKIDEGSIDAIKAADDFINSKITRCETIYGTNTQFGDQVRFTDPYLYTDNSEAYSASVQKRQESLIKSHYAGMGNPVHRDVVKIAMLIRAHTMAQGYSGVTQGCIEKIIEWIHADACPEVFKYGSIGASGDLIPLATIAAAVIGEPVTVNYKGKVVKATDVPIEPYKLKNREGLAFINGTGFMTALATVTFSKLERLFDTMLDVIGTTLEVLQVNAQHYDPLLNQVKNHPGSIKVGEHMLPFLEKSDEDGNGIICSLQNFYSLRSVSQGFGPFYENMQRCKVLLEREINAVDDNPLCDTERGRVIHGANFMGYYITEVCDSLKKDIAQASTWLHALQANMYHPRKSNGLPTNIMEKTNTFSGFRPLQLLACSITVENRKLAQNHQAFMLPTEGDNQDVNSLGTHSAFDLKTSVDNLENLCCILYLSACQAWDYREQQYMSERSKTMYNHLRAEIPKREEDKLFKPDLDLVKILIKKL